MKLIVAVMCVIFAKSLSFSQAKAQGLIAEFNEMERRLSCVEEKLARAPQLEEVGRTSMSTLDMTSDRNDRDLDGSRLELPSDVRSSQIVLQYNFSRYLGELPSSPWIMYHLVVDGTEQPAARAIVSGRHATHSGVWIGDIAAGTTPVVVEFEYAANGLSYPTREVNEKYEPVDGVGSTYRVYESAQVVAYLVSPPPDNPNCGN
ncbi:hypothetical protein [uncultured Tateyamaria sp.]|uniref:hypothetical protein n=1 Tax=uncultured Tateyamaria sp. TaxID=455651 RepID=UPI00260F1360|nr:hypothetical protein [uncultured Tateyamaria sp.]